MKKIGVVNSLVLSVCDTNHQGLFLAIPIRCPRLDPAIHSMKLKIYFDESLLLNLNKYFLDQRRLL